MSAATVSNVRPDKTRKSALSPAALVAFIATAALLVPHGRLRSRRRSLGIALAGRKEPRRVSLAIPLFDVGLCLYRRLQQRDRAP